MVLLCHSLLRTARVCYVMSYKVPVCKCSYDLCNMVCLCLFIGSIPSEIGQLTSLTYLRLSFNSLTGTSGDVMCDNVYVWYCAVVL